MEKYAKFLAAIDGTKTWAEIRSLFDDAFHRDVVVVTGDAELDKDQWAEMVKGVVEKGGVTSDFEVAGRDGDSYYYELTVTVDDEVIHTTAKGTVKDGRLVRVERVYPDLYPALVERSN